MHGKGAGIGKAGGSGVYMQGRLGKISIIGFILNIAFWLWIFLNYSFIKFYGNGDYILARVLLFFEPVIFIVALMGYLRKRRVIYILSILFLTANSLLSITDEVGFMDIVSLFMNIGLALLLAVQWKDFRSK